jgi:hypothetical protein
MNNKVKFSFLLCFSACFGPCTVKVFSALGHRMSEIELPEKSRQAFCDAVYPNDCVHANNQYMLEGDERMLLDLSQAEWESLPDEFNVVAIRNSIYPDRLCVLKIPQGGSGRWVLLGDFAELALPKEAPILTILLQQNPGNLPYIGQLVALTKAVILKMPSHETLEISKDPFSYPFSYPDFQRILMLSHSCDNRGLIENIIRGFGLQIRALQECVPGLE